MNSKRLRIFVHIMLGLLLGLFVGLIYLSSTDNFKNIIAARVEQQFAKDYGHALQCRLEKIDWLSLKIIFSHVEISPTPDRPLAEQWSMHADKLVASASWWHLLHRHQLKIDLQFEHMVMFEVCHRGPVGLSKFCSRLFVRGEAAFVVYGGVSIKDGLMYFEQPEEDIIVQVPYACNIYPEASGIKIQFYLRDGSVLYKDATIVRDIEGSIICDMPYSNILTNLNAQVQLNYFAMSLPRQEDDTLSVSQTALSKVSLHEGAGFVAGKMEKGVGEFAIKSEDGSMAIDPINIQCLSTGCLCKIGVAATSELIKYFDLPDFVSDLSGQAGVEMQADLYDLFNTFSINASLGGIMYKSQSIFPGGKVTINHRGAGVFAGTMQITDTAFFDLMISVDDNVQKMHMSNAQSLKSLQYPDWLIEQNKCNVRISSTKLTGKDQASLIGDYDVEFYNSLLDERHNITGSFSVRDQCCFVQGAITLASKKQIMYEGKVPFAMEGKGAMFQVHRDGKVIIDVATDPSSATTIVGQLAFDLLHDLVPDPFKISFAQEGDLNFRGYVHNGICFAKIDIDQACMRIPNLYNVIQGIHASCQFNVKEKSITCSDVDVAWYEGELSCSRATFYFDECGSMQFVHMPLLLHDVMLSWDRGVYSSISGRLLLTKKRLQDLFNIEGQLMLQKAELKENLFSSEFQEILSGAPLAGESGAADFNCTYDVSIFTKDPLSVNTSFLSAKAIVDLCVKGTLKKPELSGAIQLISGLLSFPYKPLEITDGRLLFIPEQPFDPIVELSAKGKVKKFGISMNAWGSALDPYVKFESSCGLQEEQILSLLLLGVEDNSLGAMVPAFLMQKIRDVLFGPALSKTKLKAFFARVFKSLRYFRFIPQFTNQTGRGGLRGTFEIDASDQLHGKIDTNFMQIEDTKIDIDYDITDDVTLRLQKDGPSTYGGEVEWRWKFS